MMWESENVGGWRGLRLAVAAVLAVAFLLTPRPSQAQSGGGFAPLSDLPVQVTLGNFGVGDQARRGEWTGIRVRLKDSGNANRDVLVQLHGLDPDGDVPVYTRELTLNPGVDQSVWLYARLPFNFRGGDALNVSVYEAVEGGTKPSGEPWFNPGKLLGRAPLVSPTSKVRLAEDGMIGVLGGRTLGLGPYSERPPNSLQEAWHARGHENLEAVTGLTPADLPDRWVGLQQFDAVLWAAGEPSELRGERAKALREYVTRGGHLIIVLPAVGQTWTNPQSNELIDIMPTVAVQRNENVDPAPYRPLLNLRPTSLYPTKGITVHTFRVLPDVPPQDAVEVLSGPDGRCVVARRVVGAGAVTLVGLDINDTAFSQGKVLDAEVFWHRVLGRRGKLTTDDQNEAGPNAAPLFNMSRTPYYMDGDIPAEIAQTGKTAVGVMAGFVVFVAYWLVAGPVGYSLLKSRGYQRHAWVGFVAATALFTALAWGGATLLRPQRLEARHLTILDHVYGQPVQRARMWTSVFLPGYGERRISTGGATDAGSQAIAAWDAPGDDEGWAKFPDARDYAVEAVSPGVLRIPTRATSKHLQVDWAGSPQWKMPIPVSTEEGKPGEIRLNPNSWPVGTDPVLSGVLTHDLPGPLHDVRVVVVKGQETLIAPGPESLTQALDKPIMRASTFVLAEWRPGTENALDLGVLTSRPSSAAGFADDAGDLVRLLAGVLPTPPQAYTIGQAVPNDPSARESRLSNIAFLNLLPPPNVQDNTLSQWAALRRATHGWDLSRWVTQPCVIVIGHLGGNGDDRPSPVPLLVDGQEVPTRGRTVVRWIYLLPSSPPAFPVRRTPATPAPPTAPAPATTPPGNNPG